MGSTPPTIDPAPRSYTCSRYSYVYEQVFKYLSGRLGLSNKAHQVVVSSVRDLSGAQRFRLPGNLQIAITCVLSVRKQGRRQLAQAPD